MKIEGQAVKLYCDKHTPPEGLPPIMMAAMAHVMVEAVFKKPEFIEIVEKHMGDKKSSSPKTMKAIVEEWNTKYPYACCFLGDAEYLRLIDIELPKAVLFGVTSEPISDEEVAKIELMYPPQEDEHDREEWDGR